MASKKILIGFEIEGRKYEAVGFLAEMELSVDGDIMLERTSKENGGAIGAEDEAFLLGRSAQFPTELRRYYLATNRRHSGNQRFVSCFVWSGEQWLQLWSGLGGRYGNCLVLRRCT